MEVAYTRMMTAECPAANRSPAMLDSTFEQSLHRNQPPRRRAAHGVRL